MYAYEQSNIWPQRHKKTHKQPKEKMFEQTINDSDQHPMNRQIHDNMKAAPKPYAFTYYICLQMNKYLNSKIQKVSDKL